MVRSLTRAKHFCAWASAESGLSRMHSSKSPTASSTWSSRIFSYRVGGGGINNEDRASLQEPFLMRSKRHQKNSLVSTWPLWWKTSGLPGSISAAMLKSCVESIGCCCCMYMLPRLIKALALSCKMHIKAWGGGGLQVIFGAIISSSQVKEWSLPSHWHGACWSHGPDRAGPQWRFQSAGRTWRAAAGTRPCIDPQNLFPWCIH